MKSRLLTELGQATIFATVRLFGQELLLFTATTLDELIKTRRLTIGASAARRA